MKAHQIAAIVVGIVLSVVSFIPVLVTIQEEYDLAHPEVVDVFIFPTLGTAVSAIIVFIAFVIKRN